MKRFLSVVLVAFALFLGCIPSARAVDNSREYFFELSVDGTSQKEVQTGDIITVVFTLYRTDSDADSAMYAMQNEIRYDSEFFTLVEGSAMLSSGITTTEIGLRDNYREFYMNFVSLTGGEMWNAKRLVGSFQLKVTATSGVSKITNQDYLVSTAAGDERFAATCQDVTIIVSSECNVKFESNGGTFVPAQTVPYGEKLSRPDNPTREGYRFVGWYRDIDLQIPWEFDTDTVQGNMTLYAKWRGANEPGFADEETGGSGLWWLLGMGLAGLILLLLLFFGKKTVHFETGCDITIREQRVKKGDLVACPREPVRPGRLFAGWYADEDYQKQWDFEKDTVEETMTLYARWL